MITIHDERDSLNADVGEPTRLRMAVIGVGHLGQHHARILSTLNEVELVGVVDHSPDQARLIAERCHTQAFTDYRALIGKVDAVSIVVPTEYHHEVTMTFLEAGIPVLVEKPIATTLEQAREMVAKAREKQIALQVGHIERFNPAFEQMLDRPIQPKFIECERHGPFTGRSTDIGAVLDLMIHDLDLLLAINRCEATHVEAMGASVFGGHEDMVNARIRFKNGCIAHVTASRVSQAPKRKLRIWAPEGYAGVDFVRKRLILVQSSDNLRKYGMTPVLADPARRARLKEELFTEHMQTLDLDCNTRTDQLTSELKSFVRAVKTGEEPRVTGEDGLEALSLAHRVLEAVAQHPWTGEEDGPHGAPGFPAPLGKLFEPIPDVKREAA